MTAISAGNPTNQTSWQARATTYTPPSSLEVVGDGLHRMGDRVAQAGSDDNQPGPLLGAAGVLYGASALASAGSLLSVRGGTTVQPPIPWKQNLLMGAGLAAALGVPAALASIHPALGLAANLVVGVGLSAFLTAGMKNTAEDNLVRGAAVLPGFMLSGVGTIAGMTLGLQAALPAAAVGGALAAAAGVFTYYSA